LSFIVEQSVAIGKPIIGVSINYRLSLWGFTSSKELANEGLLNIGLRDQRLALHWVQENIKAFGGVYTPTQTATTIHADIMNR
jgi:carboxylesterase type B